MTETGGFPVPEADSSLGDLAAEPAKAERSCVCGTPGEDRTAAIPAGLASVAGDAAELSAQAERMQAMAELLEENNRLRDACRLLGRALAVDERVMFAARIENNLNGPEAAMRWIVRGSNTLADQDAGRPWDGRESAQEWFDAVESAESGQ